MDREKLKKILQPVIAQCEAEKIHISDVTIEEVEMFMGTASPQFYVDLCIPSLTGENYNDIYDRVFDIYWDMIDKDIRRCISDFCVVNECVKYCGDENPNNLIKTTYN